jgi:hypothetical protein
MATLVLIACGRSAPSPRPAATPPPLPAAPPTVEDARVAAFVAEINGSLVADCELEYQSAHDGEGGGSIVFHGPERHMPT